MGRVNIPDTEVMVLNLLAVFEGGAAAQTLIQCLQHKDVGGLEVLSAIKNLADRSEIHIVESVNSDGMAIRYALPPACRDERLKTLRESGEYELYVPSLVSFCQTLAVELTATLIAGPGERDALDLAFEERDNIAVALRYCIDARDGLAAAEIASGVWRMWELRGLLAEGRRWMEQIIELLGDQCVKEPLIDVLDGAGMLCWRQGDLSQAADYFRLAIDLAHEDGNYSRQARLLNHQGLVALFDGNLDLAREKFLGSLDLCKQLDLAYEAALASSNFALLEATSGNPTRCIEWANEALTVQHALGDTHGQATSLLHRAIGKFYNCDIDDSIRDAATSATMFAGLKDDRNLCFSLYCLACALSRKGEGDATGRHRNGRMSLTACEVAAAAEAIRQHMKIPFPADWASRLELAMGRDLADPTTLPPSRPVEALLEDVAAWLEAKDAEKQLHLPPPPKNLVLVKLLGGFSVTTGRCEVKLAPQVARLVKLVAASPVPLHVESVIETLWPEVDCERGRHRLRNVMSRLARTAGPILVREGDSIRIAGGVEVDLRVLESALDSATRLVRNEAEVDEVSSEVRLALAMYRQQLFPLDSYEPWAESKIVETRDWLLRTLDAWTALALKLGRTDLAEEALRSGVEVDPTDERRYCRLAQLLLDTGRPMAAQTVLEAALNEAEKLGVVIDASLEALSRRCGLDCRTRASRCAGSGRR